jgi:hypothetical protein
MAPLYVMITDQRKIMIESRRCDNTRGLIVFSQAYLAHDAVQELGLHYREVPDAQPGTPQLPPLSTPTPRRSTTTTRFLDILPRITSACRAASGKVKMQYGTPNLEDLCPPFRRLNG